MKKIIYSIILIIYTAVLFYFMLTPSLKTPTGMDKLLHFIAFFVFAFILIKTCSLFRINILFPLIISIALAILTEFMQIKIKTRTFSLFDMAFNLSAITIAFIIKWKSYRQ